MKFLFSTEEYLLEDAKKYNFLTRGKVVVPAMDDVQEFQATVNAMQIMGMTEEDIGCESRLRFILTLYLFLPSVVAELISTY